MKILLLTLAACTALCAQSPSFFVTDPTVSTIVGPLPATYQFPDTPAASSSSVVIRVTNPSTLPIEIVNVFVANAAGSAVLSPSFTVTGLALDKILTPQSANFENLTVSFTPPVAGSVSAELRVAYAVQQQGCVLQSSDPSLQCPSTVADVSAFQGNGTAAQLVATYTGPSGSGQLQPNASSPQLDFGNVSTSATASFTITLANQTATAMNTPAVSVQNPVFGSSAFALNTSALPGTIGPNASASFVITFAPGQTGLTTATLAIGSNTYPLVGTGIVVADIDALQISYIDQTGVRTSPQAATPISFGQVTAGTNGTVSLLFTVTNPAVSFDAVVVQNIAVTGAGFSITVAANPPPSCPAAPTMPASIQPGACISFAVTFSASATGTYSGTLSIGTRQFSLVAQSVSLPLPDISFQLDEEPLTSQHQVHLSIQLAGASPITAIGELTVQFTPLVKGITDDPAIYFLATGGRELQVTIATGAKNATYNGQSALTFQTGTTAGTLTFTLAFPDKAPLTQSFTISPQQIQISSSLAVRQNPNLVITLTGYDNTYSAGKLSFVFRDTAGNVITPNGIQVDATPTFHKYFFLGDKAGGAFSLQASFPVTGDVTQIGSVDVTLTNSVGTTTVNQNFQ